MGSERVVRTICQGCHCECGVFVHVQDERVVKIEGDPDHPMNEGILCPKGLAYTQLLYHPDRLKYPMVRAGGKGEGKWKRVSWDEALDIWAKKFSAIIEQYGPYGVAFTFGTAPRASLGAYFGLYRALGSPNWACDDIHYCFGPSIIAGFVTYGGFLTAEVGPDYKNSNCILIWAGNPVHSHPTRGKDIMEARARGAKLIVVDPRLTGIASKADLWLQVRPGTDDALALGFLNVIINGNLFDKEFVEKWCVGFEALKERVQDYSPKRVAEITWVSEEKIIQAAEMYAKNRPSALHNRVGIEMHTNSVQTIRALCILIAVTGNLDQKGGNVFPRYPKGLIRNYELRYTRRFFKHPAKVEEGRVGAKDYPLLCGPESPIANAHPPSLIRAALTGDPYPIKGWLSACDIVMALQNTLEVRDALKRMEWMVTVDFFKTPTAEVSDLILPAATWLEKDDVCEYSYLNYASARQKVISPLFECRDETWIVLELAKKMGLRVPLDSVETVDDWNNFLVKDMGISFEEFKKRGTIFEPIQYRKYEQEGFGTPSGKVELYSSILNKYGYDPLPYYAENPESPISTPHLLKDFPLILMTGWRHVVYFHSSNRQIPWLREIYPEPTVEIHPKTAEEMNIREGDWVWIETPRGNGRIRQRASLTEGIHPKVINASSHWWFPEDQEPEHGYLECNINAVMPSGPPYDPIAGSQALRGLLCRIYKA